MLDLPAPRLEAKGSNITQANQGSVAVVIDGDRNIVNISSHRIPLQRPPRAIHFQDRKDDLAQLLADLQVGRVVTLCGPGGIGKSALAAEAVWQLAPGTEPPARFPDGILFYSFYNQSQISVALEHIVHSFGEVINSSPQDAARRVLAGRRALLMLDGTEQADDLHKILTVCGSCGVLITSRQRKDVADKRQDLLPLPLCNAIDLLQAWGGVRATDRNVLSSISELVGRLPLALRLVGRYLAENEENAIDYLAWLEMTPLAALDQGRRQLESVSVLMERSVTQVSNLARQVLGVIGLLSFAPLSWEYIAAALALPSTDIRHALGELVNYGLLLRIGETYEVTHVLIHTYSRERLSPSTKTVNRLIAYYTDMAERNQQHNYSTLDNIRPHVLALLVICSERQAWTAGSKLVWSIDKYLDLRGYWTERIIVLKFGLTAAQMQKNRKKEGNCLGRLGVAYSKLRQSEKAIEHFEQALVISREITDRRREGHCLGNLGIVYRHLGQSEKAIEYHEQALVISREINDRHRERADLSNLGLVYDYIEQHQKAIEYFRQALVLAREIDDRHGEAASLGNLGATYCELEQYQVATECLRQALALARETDDRNYEMEFLNALGDLYHKLNQIDDARECWEQALQICEETTPERVTEVRSWLLSLGWGWMSVSLVGKWRSREAD